MLAKLPIIAAAFKAMKQLGSAIAAATYMEMSTVRGSRAIQSWAKNNNFCLELFAVLAFGLPHNCVFVRRCLFFPSFKKSKGCMLLEVPPQSSPAFDLRATVTAL